MTLPKLSSVSVSSSHVSANSHGFSILSKHPHPNNLVHSHSLSHTNTKENGTSKDEIESLKKNNPSSWDPSDDIKLASSLERNQELGLEGDSSPFPESNPQRLPIQMEKTEIREPEIKQNGSY